MTVADLTSRRTSALSLTALGLGTIAAVLTTLLSLVSLALLAPTLVCGLLALRRGDNPLPAAVGMTAGAVSAYVIVLEVVLLGG